MNRYEKFLFYLCMTLSGVTMITGHLLIMNAGKWFIPGQEKYNLHTRWVSDFAAVYPEGWFIKGSIILFCIAWIVFMRPHFRAAGDHLGGHVHWGWSFLLTIGVVGGLLLVAFYDMSPPQFTAKDPSWLGKLVGEKPRRVEVSRTSQEYIEIGHHRLGFLMFLISFALALLTAAVDKYRAGRNKRIRRDIATLLLAGIAVAWLFKFHQSLAGIPQRFLLVVIGWWVCQEAWNSVNYDKPCEPQPEALPVVP
jgi:hypothetical protein